MSELSMMLQHSCCAMSLKKENPKATGGNLIFLCILNPQDEQMVHVWLLLLYGIKRFKNCVETKCLKMGPLGYECED